MSDQHIPEGFYVVEDADGERFVRKPITRYAPYGPNADGTLTCGVPVRLAGGWTGNRVFVTCLACKRACPGIWPETGGGHAGAD